jgi:hypothetical protein
VPREAEYIERLRRHLADYRERELKVPAGEWGTPPREYGHILPPQHKQLNIIEPLRANFWRAHAAHRWRLHRFFHHLTSSQAFAFNLFFPLYPNLPPSFMETRRLLSLRGTDPVAVDFEVELSGGDGTNIDVLLTDHEDRRTVVEVKLTEAAFGRARPNCRHLVKLANKYAPSLRGRVADSVLEPAAFFRDYQLYRNLAQLRPGLDDRVVLLLPKARSRLWRFANEWCRRQELGTFSGLISVVAVEDLIVAMQADARSAAIDPRPFQAVESKYMVPPSP